MSKFNVRRSARADRKFSGYWIPAIALGAALPAADVYAQSATPAKTTATAESPLEEVVVTALKANVSVQDAPTTVNVVPGELIESRGITAVEQLTSAVPGVRINQAPGGLINPVVRGLGSSPSNNSFEQTVGLFVDGMFAGHPREYSSALFDVERVELLKGTQASVVGKNTSVGAISVVTKKPAFEFGGNASYFHEFELGGYMANAALNVPFNDRLALRVAALVSDEDGWIRNVLQCDDEPHVERRAARATLRYRPSDSLDWTLSAQYTESDMDGQLFKYGFDALGNGPIVAARGGDTGFVIRRYETRWTPRPGFSYLGFSQPGSETDGSKFNSTVDWQLGSGTLTFITGYGEYTDTMMIDASALALSPVIRIAHEEDETFSQEVRYATEWSGPFNLIAGVYYYWDEWKYDDMLDFQGSQLVAPPLGGAVRTTYTQETETASAFAQGTYDLTEKLKLIGGIRFEDFAKDASYGPRTILRPGSITAAVYGAYPAFERDNSDEFFDWSVQAQYFITPGINTYVSFATGTKGFGFVAVPTSPGGVVTDPFYKTEESKTAELGVKADLGSRGTLNVALFNTEIKDYQIGINLGTRFLIRNDQIRSRGVELNLNMEVFEGLKASLVATYADVEKQPPLPANSIPTLPFAPKWSGIAGLSYSTPFGNALRFTGDITAEFRSRQYLNDVGNFVMPPSKERAITDVRLAVERETGLEVAVIARNVFDTYTVNYAFNTFGATGGVQIAEERPRTVGVQVAYRFH